MPVTESTMTLGWHHYDPEKVSITVAQAWFSVIKSGLGLTLCLSLILSLGGVTEAQSTGTPEELSDSIVRVYLRRGFPGVIEGRPQIQHIQVDEVAELQGAVVSSEGHVISYLGGFWPTVVLPGLESEWWIETRDGARHPAEIVGVDERIAVAVFVSPDVAGRPLLVGSRMEEKKLRFVSLSGPDLKISVPMIVHSSSSRVVPSRFLEVVEKRGPSSESDQEGGFVLDDEGQLVGVIRRGYHHPFSKKIRIWEVLPSQVLKESMDLVLSEKGNVSAGWLGIVPMSSGNRVHVLTVVPKRPADIAGIHPGDTILALDEEPISGRSGLLDAVRWRGAGGDLSLSVLRSGQVRNLIAHLTTRQDVGPSVYWRLDFSSSQVRYQAQEERVRVYRSVLSPLLDLGLILGAVPAVEMSGDPRAKVRGLEIRAVVPDSRAMEMGLQEGDLLTEINGQGLGSPSDFRESVRGQTGRDVVIQLLRKGRSFTRKLTLP